MYKGFSLNRDYVNSNLYINVKYIVVSFGDAIKPNKKNALFLHILWAIEIFSLDGML